MLRRNDDSIDKQGLQQNTRQRWNICASFSGGFCCTMISELKTGIVSCTRCITWLYCCSRVLLWMRWCCVNIGCVTGICMMRITQRCRLYSIACQNRHITYFSAYNGVFKIPYAEIMQCMQKFAYMPHIFTYIRSRSSAFSLTNVHLRPFSIYLAADDYWYL